jgi:hypothetical protein
LKSLPILAVLDLDESEIDDEGLCFLTGASNLGHLSLNRTKIQGPGLAQFTFHVSARIVEHARDWLR